MTAVDRPPRLFRDVRANNGARYAAALRQLGPFAVTALAAWVTVLIGTSVNWAEYAASVALLAISWTYGVIAGVRGQMLTGTVLGSLGFLAALALARNSVGGSVAAISIISLLPVVPDRALRARSARSVDRAGRRGRLLSGAARVHWFARVSTERVPRRAAGDCGQLDRRTRHAPAGGRHPPSRLRCTPPRADPGARE